MDEEGDTVMYDTRRLPKKVEDRIKLLAAERRLHELGLDGISGALTGKYLLKEHEIVSGKHQVNTNTGVYFLIKDDRVVYVGQTSLDIFGRVAAHRASKDFDSFAYIPCDVEILDAMESLYIYYLEPPLNGHVRRGNSFYEKAAPLKLDELLQRKAA